MTKTKKLIVPIIITSMLATPLVANFNATSILGNSPVYADEVTDTKIEGSLVQVTNTFTKVARYNEITWSKMPRINCLVAYTVVVKNPRGTTVLTQSSTDYQAKAISTNNEIALTPDLRGTYTISIRAAGTDNITTLCDDITFEVEDVDYSMSLPTNNYWVLPSKVATGSEIHVAVPSVYVDDNDTAESYTANVARSNEGVVTGTGIIVTVSIPGANPKYLLEGSSDYVSATATVPASFKFTASSDGTTAISYAYYKEGKKVATISSTDLYVQNNYDVSSRVELGVKLAGAWTTTPKLGDEITLPKVNAYNKKVSTTDTISAYTKIVVTYIGDSSTTSDDVVEEVTDYKFTPKHVGNYDVKYTVSIPNLGTSVTYSFTKTFDKVQEITKPTLQIVEDYSISGGKILKDGDTVGIPVSSKEDDIAAYLENKDYNLNSTYMLSGDSLVISIPAAIGIDNATDVDHISVKREVYKETNQGNLLNTSDTNTKEAIDVTITSTGKYYVKYTVTDEVNGVSNKTITTTRTIIVKSEADLIGTATLSTVVPTVNICSFDKKVDSDALITFSANPTATDYKSQDATLKVLTYYSLNEDLSAPVELGVSDKNDDGYYQIDLSQITLGTSTKLYVYARAWNNYNSSYYGQSTVQTIEIRNSGEVDTVAPTFTIQNNSPLDDGTLDTFNENLANLNEITGTITDYGRMGSAVGSKAPFDQLDVVKLPGVQFSDASNGVTVEVKVYYNAENSDKVTEVKSFESVPNVVVTKSGTNYVYTVTGTSFQATYAGLYTVTYYATDEAGNATVRSYGIRINDTVAPTVFTVEPSKFESSVEVGTEFVVPDAQVNDNGAVLSDADVSWTVTGTGRLKRTTYGFIPLSTGDYVIVYTASDGDGNTANSEAYTVTAVAETSINVTLNAEYDETQYSSWDNGGTALTSVDLIIPTASCTLPNGLGTEDVVPTIVDASGTKYTPVLVDSQTYKFSTAKQGKYTITYSYTDEFGRTASKEITIKTGDWRAPTFEWTNQTEDFDQTVDLNSTWKFDKTTMIEVSDDSGVEDVVTKTTMKYSDGTDCTTNDDGAYVFDKSGTYTFRITLTDQYGNTDTTSYTITVAAEESDTTTKDSSVLSTILIIASVVILGGVVTYFVLSGRKSKKSKKTDNK